MEKNELFSQPSIKVINLGLESFNEAVKMQGVQSVQIDWRPPAGGNMRLIEIIERLKEMG